MTVTVGNQLVECQECHNLYHQDCHKTPVTDKEVNDPRLVWYCARCTRQMKRMVRKLNRAATLFIVPDRSAAASAGSDEMTLFSVRHQGPETPTETVPCIRVIRAGRERRTGEEDGAQAESGHSQHLPGL